jgi:hypothetical protein
MRSIDCVAVVVARGYSTGDRFGQNCGPVDVAFWTTGMRKCTSIRLVSALIVARKRAQRILKARSG